MRLPITRPNLALAAAGALLLGAGLTIGATTPTPFDRVGDPTPSASFTLPAVMTRCEEDMPCWRCEDMGNMRCGNFPPGMERSAWAAWETQGGADRLLVNTHAKVTLVGYMTHDPYAKGGPALATREIALSADGIWYVFRADQP